MGIRDRPTAPQSPWQNGHAERLIGSIRRECVDHVIVFGDATSASSAALVPAVLQRHPNTSVTGQGLTGAESRPCHRDYSSVANPWRIASPLCPDLICDMDRDLGGSKRHSQRIRKFEEDP